MGVADFPIRVIDAPHMVRLEEDVLAGNPKGLISQRLSVNPDNPQEGRLWTQWRSLDDAKAFADRLANKPDSGDSVQPTGPPTFLADPQFLTGGAGR